MIANPIEGLVMDWHWIGNEWATDCQSIGNVFVLNWHWIACFGDWHFSDLAPDWDGLALDRHRTGDGLTSDR